MATCGDNDAAQDCFKVGRHWGVLYMLCAEAGEAVLDHGA